MIGISSPGRQRPLLAALASSATVLALAGCGPSGADGPDAPATTAAVTGTPSRGAVHFIDYSVNSDGPGSLIILTGAVGDYGRGVAVYPDGKVDPDHTSELELRLTHGSFRLDIAGLDKAIQKAYQHWPSNRHTCSGSITVTAATAIVAGSGTGLYRGISGPFTSSATIDEVDKKPVCDGTSAFISQVILITGTGTVTQSN